MNRRSKKQALEEEDSHYHAGPPMSGDMSEDKSKAKKGPKRTTCHVKKCALARMIEGESIMVLNEAPTMCNEEAKDSNYEQKETLRHKTPAEEIFHKIYDLHNDMEQNMYTD